MRHELYYKMLIWRRKQFRRYRWELRCFIEDCWHWKWIIFLIVIELARLHVEVEMNSKTLDELQMLRGVVIDFYDAVVPGPKG